MSKQISSFNDVQITKNTLIICDIDDTILYYPDCEQTCIKLAKELYNDYTITEFVKEVKKLYSYYKFIHKPVNTDYDGFQNLTNKLKENDGKLLFLTAII